MNANSRREWLEADGLGGFASGTVAGFRTRRHHALLLTARTPPTGRVVLVNGFDAWVETNGARLALSSQWVPGVTALNNGTYSHDPQWYFNFLYSCEQERGLDCVEDLATPGSFSWQLNSGEADLILATTAYATDGTRFGIHVDSDGLVAAGESGVQLTWMDAKVGDWVVTPRIGKPVEVQALWLNALAFAIDVVDANHRAGVNDPSLRPNQVFAMGGCPFQAWSVAEALRLDRVVL
jgi:glycogen debranching enzyme